MESFLCNNCKIAAKPAVHNNPAFSKALSGKFENHWSEISILNLENYCIPHRPKLLGQATKQTSNDFGPQKPWKCWQFQGLRPDPNCLWKKQVYLVDYDNQI